MSETQKHTPTREQLERDIASISAILKGPGVSNLERLLLNADRRDLREQLAALSKAGE
jgi:hypothetical protein